MKLQTLRRFASSSSDSDLPILTMLTDRSVRASPLAHSSHSQVGDKTYKSKSVFFFKSPSTFLYVDVFSANSGLRNQDVRAGRHDRLPEHRDGQPLHERHAPQQALRGPAHPVSGRWSVRSSSPDVMRQDPVHQGVPEELLAGPALHLLDLEHSHPQVRGGQDHIEL